MGWGEVALGPCPRRGYASKNPPVFFKPPPPLIMYDHTVAMDTAIQFLRHVQIGEPISISEAAVNLYEKAQISLFNVSPRKRYGSYGSGR